MMDRDAVTNIRRLHADALDILSAFRSIATTEISDGEAIHGTVIDTLARQADQMLTEAGEILDGLLRRVPALDVGAAIATAEPEPPARERAPDAGDLRLDIEDGRNAIEEILCGTRALRELLAHPWKPDAVAGLQGAALWSVGNVESDADNALAALEDAARALGVPESAS